MVETCSSVSVGLIFFMLAAMANSQFPLETPGTNPMLKNLLNRERQQDKFEQRMRSYLSEQPGELVGKFSKDEIEQVRKQLNSYPPVPILEPTCHVEVQETKRLRGRCLKLAGRVPVCQAQGRIIINHNDCL